VARDGVEEERVGVARVVRRETSCRSEAKFHSSSLSTSTSLSLEI